MLSNDRSESDVGGHHQLASADRIKSAGKLDSWMFSRGQPAELDLPFASLRLTTFRA